MATVQGSRFATSGAEPQHAKTQTKLVYNEFDPRIILQWQNVIEAHLDNDELLEVALHPEPTEAEYAASISAHRGKLNEEQQSEFAEFIMKRRKLNRKLFNVLCAWPGTQTLRITELIRTQHRETRDGRALYLELLAPGSYSSKRNQDKIGLELAHIHAYVVDQKTGVDPFDGHVPTAIEFIEFAEAWWLNWREYERNDVAKPNDFYIDLLSYMKLLEPMKFQASLDLELVRRGSELPKSPRAFLDRVRKEAEAVLETAKRLVPAHLGSKSAGQLHAHAARDDDRDDSSGSLYVSDMQHDIDAGWLAAENAVFAALAMPKGAPGRRESIHRATRAVADRHRNQSSAQQSSRLRRRNLCPWCPAIACGAAADAKKDECRSFNARLAPTADATEGQLKFLNACRKIARESSPHKIGDADIRALVSCVVGSLPDESMASAAPVGGDELLSGLGVNAALSDFDLQQLCGDETNALVAEFGHFNVAFCVEGITAEDDSGSIFGSPAPAAADGPKTTTDERAFHHVDVPSVPGDQFELRTLWINLVDYGPATAPLFRHALGSDAWHARWVAARRLGMHSAAHIARMLGPAPRVLQLDEPQGAQSTRVTEWRESVAQSPAALHLSDAAVDSAAQHMAGSLGSAPSAASVHTPSRSTDARSAASVEAVRALPRKLSLLRDYFATESGSPEPLNLRQMNALVGLDNVGTLIEQADLLISSLALSPGPPAPEQTLRTPAPAVPSRDSHAAAPSALPPAAASSDAAPRTSDSASELAADAPRRSDICVAIERVVAERRSGGTTEVVLQRNGAFDRKHWEPVGTVADHFPDVYARWRASKPRVPPRPSVEMQQLVTAVQQRLGFFALRSNPARRARSRRLWAKLRAFTLIFRAWRLRRVRARAALVEAHEHLDLAKGKALSAQSELDTLTLALQEAQDRVDASAMMVNGLHIARVSTQAHFDVCARAVANLGLSAASLLASNPYISRSEAIAAEPTTRCSEAAPAVLDAPRGASAPPAPAHTLDAGGADAEAPAWYRLRPDDTAPPSAACLSVRGKVLGLSASAPAYVARAAPPAAAATTSAPAAASAPSAAQPAVAPAGVHESLLVTLGDRETIESVSPVGCVESTGNSSVPLSSSGGVNSNSSQLTSDESLPAPNTTSRKEAKKEAKKQRRAAQKLLDIAAASAASSAPSSSAPASSSIDATSASALQPSSDAAPTPFQRVAAGASSPPAVSTYAQAACEPPVIHMRVPTPQFDYAIDSTISFHFERKTRGAVGSIVLADSPHGFPVVVRTRVANASVVPGQLICSVAGMMTPTVAAFLSATRDKGGHKVRASIRTVRDLFGLAYAAPTCATPSTTGPPSTA